MTRTNFFLILITLIIVASCGTPALIVQHDQLAMQKADSGNFQGAITEWQEYISYQKANTQPINPKVYAELGKAYFNLEQYENAEIQFINAKNENYGDADMYVMLSKYYRSIDNLSKEISALEKYSTDYFMNEDSSFVRNRLFETSLESENWEVAEEIWGQMDNASKSEEKYLEIYFNMNKSLGKKEKCDELALQLLKLNTENKIGLEWLAKKYYNKAEDRYQKALASYNKKKTTATYNKLLKELDKSTTDFKKSLKHFDVLWKMDDGKKYATYLANIYARFDDKKKSQYYKGFIN